MQTLPPEGVPIFSPNTQAESTALRAIRPARSAHPNGPLACALRFSGLSPTAFPFSTYFAIAGMTNQSRCALSTFWNSMALTSRPSPIEERKQHLASLLRFFLPPGITLSPIFRVSGRTIYNHACALGSEGIVSKRLGSPYTFWSH